MTTFSRLPKRVQKSDAPAPSAEPGVTPKPAPAYQPNVRPRTAQTPARLPPIVYEWEKDPDLARIPW